MFSNTFGVNDAMMDPFNTMGGWGSTFAFPEMGDMMNTLPYVDRSIS